jgi:hypothetical protein
MATSQNATRSGESANLMTLTDEVVLLSIAATDLADTDLVGVRNAIGTLVNSSVNRSVLVLGHNTASTGLYVTTDVNGDGQVMAGEIRLLGIFNNRMPGNGDVIYG